MSNKPTVAFKLLNKYDRTDTYEEAVAKQAWLMFTTLEEHTIVGVMHMQLGDAKYPVGIVNPLPSARAGFTEWRIVPTQDLEVK